MPKGDAPALFADGELAPVPEKGATEALAIYNAVAPGAGWPEARFLTASRRAAIKRATADYGGLVGFKTHLEAASRNDFLTGKTWRDPKHANWKPDLDWFLKPANVLKVLEGKWPANTEGHAPPKSVAPAETEAAKWSRWLKDYRPGRFWPSSQGYRPEDPRCSAPADLLEWWRGQHGVVLAQAPQESPADRRRATIASLRRAGLYDRANTHEEALAALEGRPAVLVPAPSVAGVGLADSPKTRPMPDSGKATGAAPDIICRRPPPMRTYSPPVSEAQATRAMAAAQDAEWEMVPEGDEALAEP